MILRSIENGYEDAYHALGVCLVVICDGDLIGGIGYGTGKEGTSEVADGGYDHGEVVTAVPEAVVGGLITEDLSFLLICGVGYGVLG